MTRKINYIEGQKLGECFFVREVQKTGKERMAEFVCGHCSSRFISVIYSVKSLITKSCGCEKLRLFIARTTTHAAIKKGLKSEYGIWSTMKARCYNPNANCYKNYGGKGIKVCDRWRQSFTNFITDMGPKPSPNHTLDRYPDNNGDYGPSNCRWATMKQQNQNRTNNVVIMIGDEKKSLAEWCDILGLNYKLLRQRISRSTYTPQEYFNLKVS